MVYHDPAGRMLDQLSRTLPAITSIYADVIVQASTSANEHGLQLFEQAGAVISPTRSIPAANGSRWASGAGIGRLRRNVVELAFQHSTASHVIYCVPIACCRAGSPMSFARRGRCAV
jgi:hypothetical protein